ncbi:4Fe-4S dicluster domain-containing protein [Oleidesulfovibrio alaskensis]|uniref:4Fe-4S dicluster domain-containing protein n=1 Tax=Oleidesulfovibrio alaskensis TaxID=58180 RepID=UPI000411494F|nr:4Fe-4S dicluster domain-containing protein [Oleidesulfovibrio alaskensis]
MRDDRTIRRCDAAFTQSVQQQSEQNMALCYQCGNCTAGCPVARASSTPVTQVMRLVQAGQREAALEADSIWLCASCETCTTRCPNDIDVARVMDVLRHMARRENHVAEKNIRDFWDAFLESVEKHGRVYEVGLMAAYVRKTGRFWTDADLAPAALGKGKLPLRPHPVTDKEAIRQIFRRYRERSA